MKRLRRTTAQQLTNHEITKVRKHENTKKCRYFDWFQRRRDVTASLFFVVSYFRAFVILLPPRLRKPQQRPSVLRDHPFLVGRNYPGGNLALRRRDARAPRGVCR